GRGGPARTAGLRQRRRTADRRDPADPVVPVLRYPHAPFPVGRRLIAWCGTGTRTAPEGLPLEEARMTSSTETGGVTGTPDKDYNLIWYVEACLSNALRLETYIEDATREGDSDLAELFRKAQADSRKGAEMGKQMLRSRLAS